MRVRDMIIRLLRATAPRPAVHVRGAALLAIACATAANATELLLVNPFGDPFVKVTTGQAQCPVPAPPTYTEQQVRDAAHERAQRGVSCWLDGRCRLHNSYLYDAEIIPRVQKAIASDGRFADTSIWLLGQRRHVWLKGCVHSSTQLEQLEQLIMRIDDVERVINELVVGAPVVPARAASQSR